MMSTIFGARPTKARRRAAGEGEKAAIARLPMLLLTAGESVLADAWNRVRRIGKRSAVPPSRP